MYFDVNNLSDAKMRHCLPFDSFEWISPENFNVMDVSDDSPIGYTRIYRFVPNILHHHPLSVVNLWQRYFQKHVMQFVI